MQSSEVSKPEKDASYDFAYEINFRGYPTVITASFGFPVSNSPLEFTLQIKPLHFHLLTQLLDEPSLKAIWDQKDFSRANSHCPILFNHNFHRIGT